jgi:hypothetical protein
MTFGGRLMVGRLALNQLIGVRIPAPELETLWRRDPVFSRKKYKRDSVIENSVNSNKRETKKASKKMIKISKATNKNTLDGE